MKLSHDSLYLLRMWKIEHPCYPCNLWSLFISKLSFKEGELKMKKFNLNSMIALIAIATVATLGCSEKKTESTDKKAPETKKEVDEPKQTADDHSGWWCNPHGIPEEVCSMCSSKYAEECKAKGDWCEEHDRAKSQCFKCDPALAEKFTKLYVAKYGKQPPKPTD